MYISLYISSVCWRFNHPNTSHRHSFNRSRMVRAGVVNAVLSFGYPYFNVEDKHTRESLLIVTSIGKVR